MTPEEFLDELRCICAKFPAGPGPRTVWDQRRSAILAAVARLTDAELDTILKTRLDEIRLPLPPKGVMRGLPKAIHRAASDCLLNEREQRMVGNRHEPRQRTAWDWVTESTC